MLDDGVRRAHRASERVWWTRYVLRTGLALHVASCGLVLLGQILQRAETVEQHIPTALLSSSLSSGSQIVHILGTLCIIGFQLILPDDVAWTRGFRAGSKFLGLGALLDLMGSAILAVASCKIREMSPVAEAPGGGWLMTAFAKMLLAAGAIFIAQSIMYLERYKSEGESSSGAWTAPAALLYTAAAALDVAGLARFPFQLPLRGLAAAFAFFWAMSFEDWLDFASPKLHETELVNEAELQVNAYAAKAHEYSGLP